jgi:c-di-GMP-binding flagellar brake protein YcgR
MRNRWAGSDRRGLDGTSEAKEAPKTPPVERRTGKDRRHDSRIRLSLEVAVPVVVRSDEHIEAGLARNISEGGMLIQLKELPPIGTRVEVTISGIKGSKDAPDSVKLEGEVRHHVAWQYRSRGQAKLMRGIGVRFIELPKDQDNWPEWVWTVGQTIH